MAAGTLLSDYIISNNAAKTFMKSLWTISFCNFTRKIFGLSNNKNIYIFLCNCQGWKWSKYLRGTIPKRFWPHFFIVWGQKTRSRVRKFTDFFSLFHNSTHKMESTKGPKTFALSFYRSQNILGWYKLFLPDQILIFILCQSQIFCPRLKDDIYLVNSVFLPARNCLEWI